MKQILIALGLIVCVTQTQGAEQIQIDECWSFGDNVFTMKTEDSYNASHVNSFKDVSMSFHKADSSGKDTNEIKKLMDIFAEGFDIRAKEFEDGKNSLLLLSKQDNIVGGTYFKMEEDGNTVCIHGAGFKTDIPQQELGLAYYKLVTALSSSKYFPNSKRLVLFLLENSPLIDTVKKLGFTNSDYPPSNIAELSQALKDIKRLSFEKAMTK
jgi:hypothetical protein